MCIGDKVVDITGLVDAIGNNMVVPAEGIEAEGIIHSVGL